MDEYSSSITVMHQGLRDPGSRQGSGQTLESSDSGPGFRGSGTAGRVLGSGGTPRVHTGAQGPKNRRMHRDFDPWEFFENVEVNAKKKKRSRCSLCGERWWDIGVHLIAHGL